MNTFELVSVLTVILTPASGFAAPADVPAPVHERVTALDPSGVAHEVVLAGGYVDDAGVLREARVLIVERDGAPAWEGFDPALHPWLLRAGRFAGQDVIFVGVRRPTVFDPVERPRPFIYALRAGGRGLSKVWLGTSLSRPFLSADFGNLDGIGEDELVALERTRTGGTALGAYRWEGFGVEGLARSEEVSGARDVRCADVLGGGAAAAVVWAVTGEMWRFIAFRLEGERLVRAAEAGATVRGAAPSWELVQASGEQMGAVRLRRGAVTRELPFRLLRDGNRGMAPLNR